MNVGCDWSPICCAHISVCMKVITMVLRVKKSIGYMDQGSVKHQVRLLCFLSRSRVKMMPLRLVQVSCGAGSNDVWKVLRRLILHCSEMLFQNKKIVCVYWLFWATRLWVRWKVCILRLLLWMPCGGWDFAASCYFRWSATIVAQQSCHGFC